MERFKKKVYEDKIGKKEFSHDWKKENRGSKRMSNPGGR